MENFNIIAQPLSALTSNKSIWRGLEKDGPLPKEAETAFRTLQQRLCASPVVVYPILGLPYVISVDAALWARVAQEALVLFSPRDKMIWR